MTSKRSFIVTAEDNGKYLIHNLPQDETIRHAVREELSKVQAPLEAIDEKLRERKAKLQTVLIEEQETEPAYDSLIDLLSTVEFRISQSKPLSAVWQEISEQTQDQKVDIKLINKLNFSLLCSCYSLCG